DTENGITITQISHTPQEVTLTIDLKEVDVCRRNPPIIHVEPQEQTGSINQLLNYTVTLTNTDTNKCGATQFDLRGYYNNQWNISINPVQITLPPGNSASTQLTVTPLIANISGGPHLIHINASSHISNFHNAQSYAVYRLTGNPLTVRIHPAGAINTSTTTISEIGLSALAYDENSNPIWSGVTYEWGMSSTNSVGIISNTPYGNNIATFKPLRPGDGSLYVNARYNNLTALIAIPVTVTGIYSSPNPSNSPSSSPMPTPSFTINDLQFLLQQYLTTNDNNYQPQDNKINMLDAAYVIGNLN
ncbi:MAG: hypothetical protein AAB874_06135, partial [Patescibacteria group bacterium]